MKNLILTAVLLTGFNAFAQSVPDVVSDTTIAYSCPGIGGHEFANEKVQGQAFQHTVTYDDGKVEVDYTFRITAKGQTVAGRASKIWKDSDAFATTYAIVGLDFDGQKFVKYIAADPNDLSIRSTFDGFLTISADAKVYSARIACEKVN